MDPPAARFEDAASARGVKDASVLAALRAVPRERFAEAGRWAHEPPPDAVAQIVHDMRIAAASRVLVIGARSGYVAAVFAHLAAAVHVVEPDPAIAAAARQSLAAFGAPGVTVDVGRAEDGLPDRAPFDVVVAFVAMPDVPAALVGQVAPGGRLAAPLDPGWPPRRIARLTRAADGSVVREDLDSSRLMPLLGDLLVAAGVVSRGVVEDAARHAFETGKHVGPVLVERGAIREEDLYRALALQHGVPFAEAGRVLASIDRELAKLLPKKFLERLAFLPVRRDGRNVVVATSNVDLPLWEVAHALEAPRVGMELVTPTDLHRIRKALELGHIVTAGGDPSRSVSATGQDLLGLPGADASRASETFDALLVDAIAERASDIHLECYEGGVRVRFRVDGNLHDVGRYALATSDLASLVNVIKIAAGCDIAERRTPQGGRIRRRAGDQAFDLRVQTQPSLHGEHVVVRLLPQDVKPPTIEGLGFPAALAERYRRLLRDPHGLILVVGPTGSGKSTTLYAGLQLLAGDATRKVITVEDPIEYAIARIQQTQANPAVGFHFADAMRAFVRQDPDVILVGEIRDAETALEAIRASQTGHLVLSTLHCNDAVDAVQRLLDLGMHPNSIASELTAVVAQRLARRVCDGCRAPASPDPAIAAELFPGGVPADFRCFAGTGCARCSGHGTRSRVAVVEFLPVGPAIRRAISKRVVLDELRDLARGAGLVPLRDSAIGLVRDGVIPMREILDVLSAEQMAPPREPRPA